MNYLRLFNILSAFFFQLLEYLILFKFFFSFYIKSTNNFYFIFEFLFFDSLFNIHIQKVIKFVFSLLNCVFYFISFHFLLCT